MTTTTSGAPTSSNLFGIQSPTTPTVSPNFSLSGSNMSIGQFTAPTTSGSTSQPAYIGGYQAPITNPTGGNFPAVPTGTYSTSTAIPIPTASGGTVSGVQQASAIAPTTAPTIQSTLDRIKAQALAIQAQLSQMPPNSPVQASPNLSSVGTSTNLSSFSNPVSYQDLLDQINKNQTAYLQAGQQNQDELNAEQQLLQSIQNAQNFRTNLTQGELNQYGVGRPVSFDTGRANIMEQTNAVNLQNLQNAQNYAQANLGLQQTNRQIRAGVAQNLLNASIAEGGLLKPETVSPGSSLVSPTGQVQYQGSGFTAPSLADVASLANQFLSAGQASDYNTAYQMAVGALQSGFGTKNPTTASGLGASANGSTIPLQNGNSVLGYNMGTYATDPNYVAELTSTVSQIPTTATTPTSMQAYISSVAPNSPITGQMIYQASSTYGVDPRILMGVMQHESQFGTLGAAVKTFNPGNVGNVDSGATVNMGNWQTGVNRLAQELESRFVGNNQPKQRQAPVQIQPAVETLSDGTSFINQDKIPSQFTALAQLYASQSGTPILTGDEVTKARSIDITTQNLQQMGDLINGTGGQPGILGSGIGGRIGGTIKTWWNALTESDPNIASFGTYRDTAINAIQALAGGSGSSFRLSQAEIDTATSNLPTTSDNLETAQNKLAIVQSFVNKWKNELLPNQSVPSSPNQLGANNQQPTAYSANGVTYVQGQDGLYYPQS